MAKTIIVDGYNVIYKIPSLSENLEKSLESARGALAQLLMSWKSARKHIGDIFVVFDARSRAPMADVYFNQAGVAAVFADDADECIIGMIKNAKKGSDILVISADNRVRNHCRAYAVDVEYPDYLLEKRKRHIQEKVSEEKEIDAKTVFEINDLVRKTWKVG